MPLLGQKKEFPKATIIYVRKLIGKVKELNAFFTRKGKLIQGKMKLVTEGVNHFYSLILAVDGTTKECQDWSDSFDTILTHPKFISFCNKESEVTHVYKLIDELYKIELDMNKFVLERKVITDAKWTKCIDELNNIKGAMWPDIDIDIEIWEAIADIKVIPSGDSD